MKVGFTERVLRSILPVMTAALIAPLSLTAPAQAQSRDGVAQVSPIQGKIEDRVGKDLRAFYHARDYRPLWLNDFGRPSGAASMLMHHLRTSEFDGIDPKELGFNKIAKLVDRARRGDLDDIAKAEVELSEAFAA